MDEYLETLVKKEDATVTKEEKVDAVVSEPVEEQKKETIQSTPVVTDEPKKEVKIKKEEKKAGELKKEEPKKEVKKSSLTEGQECDVENIRVYNTPDENQPSKLVTGKVIFIGTVDGFDIVKYMKHGFGLVKGYAKDLKSSSK